MPNGPEDLDPSPTLTVSPPVPPAGPLMAIGGAEDKLGRRTILNHFVTLAGGSDARIVVVPTASSLGPEIVEVYDALFRRLGAGEVMVARPESREEAEDPELVARLDNATGVFMTGGNQLKLSAIVNGTAFGEALKAAHRRGVVVAGTSAGASIQSSHMVAFGTGGSTPKQRMTQLAAGLGLVRDVVIDQHFGQRNRYGRLLMLVAQSPQLLGIGIDEDTAAVITEEDGRELLRVIGKGVVTIFDGRAIVSNAHEARRTAPLLASGVVMHVLPAGSLFDLATKALVREPVPVDPATAEELALAGRDLRRLARDIAAGDISPTVLRRRRARQQHDDQHQDDLHYDEQHHDDGQRGDPSRQGDLA
ncbi:cyanophycinase [Nocardioides mesophilus]|uniref:Cyanophycinase n=1 Tax=Nocardioides mesophilus TaxID=433659 RepID=A0A7G9RB92_9ACTN|nr:cyanophycinase [Nocardioides mesophilus]QNN52867.1 cyanophycinase [Nocardioides mesophilus]